MHRCCNLFWFHYLNIYRMSVFIWYSDSFDFFCENVFKFKKFYWKKLFLMIINFLKFVFLKKIKFCFIKIWQNILNTPLSVWPIHKSVMLGLTQNWNLLRFAQTRQKERHGTSSIRTVNKINRLRNQSTHSWEIKGKNIYSGKRQRADPTFTLTPCWLFLLRRVLVSLLC